MDDIAEMRLLVTVEWIEKMKLRVVDLAGLLDSALVVGLYSLASSSPARGKTIAHSPLQCFPRCYSTVKPEYCQ
jgi:hypothetical protein